MRVIYFICLAAVISAFILQRRVHRYWALVVSLVTAFLSLNGLGILALFDGRYLQGIGTLILGLGSLLNGLVVIANGAMPVPDEIYEGKFYWKPLSECKNLLFLSDRFSFGSSHFSLGDIIITVGFCIMFLETITSLFCGVINS